jgi:hypothetical protein
MRMGVIMIQGHFAIGLAARKGALQPKWWFVFNPPHLLWTVTELRSVNSLRRWRLRLMSRVMLAIVPISVSFPALAEQFSLKCEWYAPFFVSLDTDAGRAVFESAADRNLKGPIVRQSSNEIEFNIMRVGESTYDVIWNSQTNKLTWSIAGKEQVTIYECTRTALRPALQNYDKIAPTSP